MKLIIFWKIGFFNNFFLTHNNISRELVKAHKRGVKIRVILDATAATNGYSKHNYLREHGIPVKVESWGGKMHMKAAVFDNKKLDWLSGQHIMKSQPEDLLDSIRSIKPGFSRKPKEYSVNPQSAPVWTCDALLRM